MRAVTYLHDGKRIFFDPMDGPTEVRKWLPVDHDWNPILHRAIEPRNIFFQHPRGIETYGLCKLGNFEHAAVTNHVINPSERRRNADHEEEPFSIAMAPYRGLEPWEATRADIDRHPGNFTAANRPYLLADELWSIGSVIFTMMTGRQPIFYCPKHDGCGHITTCSRGGCLQLAAAKKGCNCDVGGCEHIPDWRCTHEVYSLNRPHNHQCHHPVLNIDTHLTRARYTWRLRKVVRDLLDCDPENRVRISKVLPFTKLVEEHYREWKQGTKEGREYRDIEDDMMGRWAAQRDM